MAGPNNKKVDPVVVFWLMLGVISSFALVAIVITALLP